MAPKVAVVYYSVYGHIRTLAHEIQQGIKSAGGSSTLYQVQETLPQNVLDIIKAPPKPDDPVITPEKITEYDGVLMGIPTRFGNQPAQWRSFWDQTGGLFASGALSGKYAGVFVSTGTPGGGQETTAINALSTLAHHGMIYVPLGYKEAAPLLTSFDEIHGGSPWGAGTFAGGDGSRKPTELEKNVARIQGKQFWETVAKAFK